MLAERPADSMSTGPSGPSVSIGNYKGVMLCNRPFAGVAAAANTSGGPAKAAFVCGTVPGQMGSTAAKKDVVVAVKRTKKETALTRHKKWLSDLQVSFGRCPRALQQPLLRISCCAAHQDSAGRILSSGNAA